MKKKNTVCIAAMCAAFILSGCGNSIPDMTEQEQKIVAEYAANLLLKYDKNYEVKVVDTTAYHAEEERKAEEARKAEEEAAKKEEAEKAAEEAEASNAAEEIEQTAASIEEFYQLSNVQIQYSGFEIYNSYPEQAEDVDLYFAIGATDGNKLLVLNFDVTNVSGAETELNMLDTGAQFKIAVNGGKSQNALFTLLPDDLETYQGTLAADETVKTVLIVEVPTGESEAIESIALTAKSTEDSAQFKLQ